MMQLETMLVNEERAVTATVVSAIVEAEALRVVMVMIVNETGLLATIETPAPRAGMRADHQWACQGRHPASLSD